MRDEGSNRDWSKLLGTPQSQRDTYAAQKGFGPEVETAYANREALDYTPVDRMIEQPRYPTPGVSLLEFRREGQLGEFSEVADDSH